MYTESTFIYKKLQELFPEDPLTCDWQGQDRRQHARDRQQGGAVDTRRSASASTGTKFKERLARRPSSASVATTTLATMKQMATVWHDEAEKTKLETHLRAGRAGLRACFLNTFPKDKDAYELQCYYAELLWALASATTTARTRDQAPERPR